MTEACPTCDSIGLIPTKPRASHGGAKWAACPDCRRGVTFRETGHPTAVKIERGGEPAPSPRREKETDMDFKFKTGDKVRRVPGASYTFPGEVLACFRNKSGRPLYVVEHAAEKGLIHIFREADLDLRGEREEIS